MHGQLVIGPPGSGKSTYCKAMKETLVGSGRKVVVINMDPANEINECDIDVRELVELGEVVERLGLGPNGGLIFCVEYIAQNLSWLKDEIDKLDPTSYLIIDCPGQVELFIHNEAMRKITEKMVDEWGIKLCAVNLIDSMQCNDASRYISALAVSLSMMLQLELPHVNVLSKIDLLETLGELPFSLEFYSEVMDTSYLTQVLADDPVTAKFGQLTSAIASCVQDFGLVQFKPMSIKDAESVFAVSTLIDRATGYIFDPLEDRNEPQFVQPEE
eukprot:m.127362 g.127362  ORF g.127362 m.127362 type:complete len:272 (+) comp29267_c0_seq4:267-1082(+)